MAKISNRESGNTATLAAPIWRPQYPQGRPPMQSQAFAPRNQEPKAPEGELVPVEVFVSLMGEDGKEQIDTPKALIAALITSGTPAQNLEPLQNFVDGHERATVRDAFSFLERQGRVIYDRDGKPIDDQLAHLPRITPGTVLKAMRMIWGTDYSPEVAVALGEDATVLRRRMQALEAELAAERQRRLGDLTAREDLAAKVSQMEFDLHKLKATKSSDELRALEIDE